MNDLQRLVASFSPCFARPFLHDRVNRPQPGPQRDLGYAGRFCDIKQSSPHNRPGPRAQAVTHHPRSQTAPFLPPRDYEEDNDDSEP
jgi:hypothetical protein